MSVHGDGMESNKDVFPIFNSLLGVVKITMDNFFIGFKGPHEKKHKLRRHNVQNALFCWTSSLQTVLLDSDANVNEMRGTKMWWRKSF